jgi:hypothetical protein
MAKEMLLGGHVHLFTLGRVSTWGRLHAWLSQWHLDAVGMARLSVMRLQRKPRSLRHDRSIRAAYDCGAVGDDVI